MHAVKDCFRYKNKLLFSVLFSLYSVAAAFSQNIQNHEIITKENNSYAIAAKETFSFRNFAVFASLLGTSFAVDDNIQNFVVNHNSRDSIISTAGNEFGETAVMLPLVAAAWTAGFTTQNDRLTTTALNSAKAFAAGALITETIKQSAGRYRPYTGMGETAAEPFEGSSVSRKSFPSWHTFTAWSIITPFAEEYSRWLYLVPASTGFARIYQNMHWTSDVIMGTGIGLFSGLFFHNQSKHKFQFTGNGLIIKY